MGSGTAGKGSPVQRPQCRVRSRAQELREERGLSPEGAERALAAHRGRCQHVSPASRDRGQGVCVGERWQHSLRKDSGGRRGELAASGVRALRIRRAGHRSCPGTRGHRGTALQMCPAPRGGRGTGDQVQPVPGSSLPAAAKTGSRPGCGSADSEDGACPVLLAPGQAGAPRGDTVSLGAL